MQTYPLELVVDGRAVSMLVIGSRKIAFVYANGTTIGRIPVDLGQTGAALDDDVTHRIAAAGLDPRRFSDDVGAALRIEREARRALEVATRRAPEGRDRALATMREIAGDYEAQAGRTSGAERERLERVRARIEQLAARFA